MNDSINCDGSVGPIDLINSLGFSVLFPGYLIVGSLIISNFLYAFYHKLKCVRLLTSIETFQIFYPSLLIFVIVLPLLSPVLYQMTSILQDLFATSAMLLFINQSVKLVGGDENLVVEHSRCPLATPPLCCLFRCKKPKMTRTKMNLIILPIKIIVVLNFVILLVNAALAYNGFPPPKVPTDIPNIASFMLAPFQITAMYTYKVFIVYVEPRLRGTFPRTRGRLIFVTFILCKSTTGIFNVLEEKGVFESFEGLECIKYSQLLLPLVQMGLLLPVGFILPKVYTARWIRISQDEDLNVNKLDETNTTKLQVDTLENNSDESIKMMSNGDTV